MSLDCGRKPEHPEDCCSIYCSVLKLINNLMIGLVTLYINCTTEGLAAGKKAFNPLSLCCPPSPHCTNTILFSTHSQLVLYSTTHLHTVSDLQWSISHRTHTNLDLGEIRITGGNPNGYRKNVQTPGSTLSHALR